MPIRTRRRKEPLREIGEQEILRPEEALAEAARKGRIRRYFLPRPRVQLDTAIDYGTGLVDTHLGLRGAMDDDVVADELATWASQVSRAFQFLRPILIKAHSDLSKSVDAPHLGGRTLLRRLEGEILRQLVEHRDAAGIAGRRPVALHISLSWFTTFLGKTTLSYFEELRRPISVDPRLKAALQSWLMAPGKAESGCSLLLRLDAWPSSHDLLSFEVETG